MRGPFYPEVLVKTSIPTIYAPSFSMENFLVTCWRLGSSAIFSDMNFSVRKTLTLKGRRTTPRLGCTFDQPVKLMPKMAPRALVKSPNLDPLLKYFEGSPAHRFQVRTLYLIDSVERRGHIRELDKWPNFQLKCPFPHLPLLGNHMFCIQVERRHVSGGTRHKIKALWRSGKASWGVETVMIR